MDAVNLDVIPCRSLNVVDQILPAEAVLVLPEAGKVQVLNEVGARIWQLIDGARSLHQIVSVICTEYQVQRAEAEQDVVDFICRLHERGAVQY